MNSAEAPQCTVRCIASGLVQGVFFRSSTLNKAKEIGLNGWVKNLADGSVEVVAQGNEEAVARFAAWLWEGSPSSRVTGVKLEEFVGSVDAGFNIR